MRIAVLDDYQGVALPAPTGRRSPTTRAPSHGRGVPRPRQRRGRARRAARALRRRRRHARAHPALGRRSSTALPRLRLHRHHRPAQPVHRRRGRDRARGITVCGTESLRHRHRPSSPGPSILGLRPPARPRGHAPCAPAAGRRPSAATSPAHTLGLLGLGRIGIAGRRGRPRLRHGRRRLEPEPHRRARRGGRASGRPRSTSVLVRRPTSSSIHLRPRRRHPRPGRRSASWR